MHRVSQVVEYQPLCWVVRYCDGLSTVRVTCRDPGPFQNISQFKGGKEMPVYTSHHIYHDGYNQDSVLPQKAEQTATSRNGTGKSCHGATPPWISSTAPRGTASPWQGAVVLGTTSSHWEVNIASATESGWVAGIPGRKQLSSKPRETRWGALYPAAAAGEGIYNVTRK